jgi:hypothetical protein
MGPSSPVVAIMVLSPCISRKIIVFLMSLYTCVLEMLRALTDLNVCVGKKELCLKIQNVYCIK